MSDKEPTESPIDTIGAHSENSDVSIEETRRDFILRMRRVAITVPTVTALSLVWTSSARAY